MADDNVGDYQLWHGYTPSLVGGAIASALFGILTIFHAWRLLRTKLWFCLPFVVGGLCTFPLRPLPLQERYAHKD